MEKPLVGIVMGSKSDLPLLEGAFKVLNDFNVPFTARVISAHRTPGKAMEFAANAQAEGLKVIICAAGMAAHLAGAIAANTTLPVVGIPVCGTSFLGLDALLSTVQMPSGIPVATVAVNGAANAALLCIEMLAIEDEALARALEEKRAKDTKAVLEKNKGVENVVLAGIHRRGVPIAGHIADNIERIEGIRPPCGSIDISFYRDDLSLLNDSPSVSRTSLPFDVTDRDLVTRCVAAGRQPASTPVREIMTTQVVSARPDMDTAAAARLMGKQQIRRLPVVENGRLCGMVSLADLANREETAYDATDALTEISNHLSSR